MDAVNPPVYDAEGNEYVDRRHSQQRNHGRRDDDPEPDVERGFDFWLRLMFMHKGKLIALFSALAGVSGYLLGVFGLQSRVSKLETAVNANSTSIQKLKQNDEFKTYLLCVIVRRVDPNAVPPGCDPIIQQNPQGQVR